MKLSFNTWAYCSFPVWIPAYPIDYVIKKLAEIGYDGIELGCASPVAYPPYISGKERRRIKDLLNENNIEISSALPAPGTGSGNNASSPIKAERLNTIKSYKDAIDLAYDLSGPGRVCLYVGGWVIWGVSQDQAWEWSRDCLIEVAQYASEKDIIIAVEPTPEVSNLLETADDAIKLMKEVDMENVKVMFDTIHAYYRGDIPTDYVDRMGKDLVHMHISDVDRTPPGTNNDFKGLIEALKEIKYDRYLTMEIGFVGSIDPNDFARRSYEYLKSLI